MKYYIDIYQQHSLQVHIWCFICLWNRDRSTPKWNATNDTIFAEIMNHYCPEEMCEYDSKHLQKSMAWVSPRCNSGLLIGSPVRSWGLYAVKVCFLPVLMPAGQLPLVTTGSPVRAFDLVNKVSLVISESLSCVCWLGLLHLVNENVPVDWLCSFCSGCLYLIKQC